MGSATFHSTTPWSAKSATDARLEAKFTTFASADARASPWPSSDEKATMRNVPVPGPKKPS